METCKAHGTVSCIRAAAGPSTSSAGTADAFDQCMSGLHSLVNSIAGPKFVPPQQHDFQGLNSLGADNAAVAAFMGQQHQQLLLMVDQATAEGKHALAVQLLTQVGRLLSICLDECVCKFNLCLCCDSYLCCDLKMMANNKLRVSRSACA